MPTTHDFLSMLMNAFIDFFSSYHGVVSKQLPHEFFLKDTAIKA